MSWNEPGKDKDPWGQRNNDGPPDLDELFKNLKNKFGGMLGGGRKGHEVFLVAVHPSIGDQPDQMQSGLLGLGEGLLQNRVGTQFTLAIALLIRVRS